MTFYRSFCEILSEPMAILNEHYNKSYNIKALNLTKQRQNVNTSDNEWKSTRILLYIQLIRFHFTTEHNLNIIIEHNSEHNRQF